VTDLEPFQTLQIDEASNGRTVELHAGQQLEIRLAENRTTGFQWTLVSDGKPACTQVSHSYESSNGPPGAGGTAHWLWEAATGGAGTIQLAYRRKWEAEKPPIRTFKVQVRFKPRGYGVPARKSVEDHHVPTSRIVQKSSERFSSSK
jgi:predicted secreted protein